MMQSRSSLARIFSSITQHNRVNPSWLRFSTSMNRTADPGVHAGEPEGIDAEEGEKAALAEEGRGMVDTKGAKNKKNPLNSSTFGSSPKIESSGVNPPLDPKKQQKRNYKVGGERRGGIEDVSCVGVDGYSEEGFGDSRKRQEEEDKEYFKHHKASPLSEIELGETRKPVSQATDGTASSAAVGGGGSVIGWKEEQLESADETLDRAMRIWKESAMNGDPEAPHSKALMAALRRRGELAM